MRGSVFTFSILTLLVPAVAFAQSSAPVRDENVERFVPIADEFAAALVIDSSTGKELYSFKPEKVWPAASLTKLMGALVFFDRKPVMTRVVSILSRDEVGGGRLRVNDGAKMTIQDLVYSSIVGSANNAAQAMSRLSGLSQKTFISRMNAKAKAIGMKSSAFYDPVGMDPRNVMTARDVATLAKAAFASPVIGKAAGTQIYTFTVRNTDQVKTITSTNKLLLEDNGLYVLGGKTGYLEESRHNLVTQLRGLNSAQPKLTIVILGSPDTAMMFKTGQRLAEWAWGAYRWPASDVRTASTK